LKNQRTIENGQRPLGMRRAYSMDSAGRILVASSVPERRQELVQTLGFESHEVTEAETASQTIQEACSDLHDLLLMDSIVDGVFAHGLCRAIRPETRLGIVVLGGEGGSNPVDALNAGADDYIAAPLIMAEVAARVRAMLRRILPRRSPKQIVLEDRIVDLETRRIRGPGDRVTRLTPKEYKVLHSLITHANTSRTHQNLAQTVWRDAGHGELECMRTIVNRLRRKLEPDPERPRYILTERSVGYQFRLPGAG
jgi:two-component system, OmpR family, KDP operon response regulator KdpE